jgi:hypothetical protein
MNVSESASLQAPWSTPYSLALSYRKYPFYSTKIGANFKIIILSDRRILKSPYLWIENANKGPKIVRQGSFHIQGETAEGRGNDQAGRMKEQPFKAPFFAEPLIQGKIAVFIIPQDRVPYVGKMPADLVHPAGPQLEFQEGKILIPRNTGIPGPGRLDFFPDLKFRLDKPRIGVGPAGAYPEIPLFYAPLPAGACFSPPE